MSNNQENNTQGGSSNASNPSNQSNNRSGEKPNGSFFQSLRNMSNRHIDFNDTDMNKFMKIAGVMLLSLLSIFVFVKTINEIKSYSTIGEMPNSPYMITVSGKGEVKAVRNLAVLSFSSFGKGSTAAEAQNMAAEANNKALAFLKTKGIDEKDISTQNYNTNPTYDQKVKPCIYDVPVASPGSLRPTIEPVRPPCNSFESVITGYETNQTIEVKIRGIDKNTSISGEIIAELGETGVRVGNLDNKIDNPEALKSEARSVAIANARQEARQIARSLGVRLGEIVSFNENDFGYPMQENAQFGDAMMTKSVAPEIPGGEGKVTSNISVTFEIRQ